MLRRLLCCLAACLQAADHTGVVKFGGLPVPGASVHAAQGGKAFDAVTDAQGRYTIAGLEAAPLSVEIEMSLFASQRRELAAPGEAEWELAPISREQLAGKVERQAAVFQRAAVTSTPAQKPAQPPSGDPVAAAELARQAADGFLISGSVHNAASSPFAQLQAFGNNRRNQRSLYNGSIGMVLNDSVFDARSYSLTGQDTPKPGYMRMQGLLAFGGPIRIPKLVRRGPVFSVNYQWTRNRNATTGTGLMPSLDQRAGLFGATILDPLSGQPFAGNRIPAERISPQARALLRFFPEPNFSGSSRYNFQVPLVSGLHQDDLQTRVNKQIRRNTYSGASSLQSTRTDTPDLFGFLDTGRVLGWNATAGYRRLIDSRSFANFSFNVNRLSTRVTPYFSGRENVSGAAGIRGNNQDPINWGPPNLSFAGGLAPLNSAQASYVRNQTASIRATTSRVETA
ncbi:MAG: carboxypeptidase-like regulatory domain-containing protein [Bryobacteraceae bacterium]